MPVVESGLLALASSPNVTMQSTLSLRRSLKVLGSVIKEFSSTKMLTGIKTMFQVCWPPPTIALLVHLHRQITDQLRNIILAYYSQLSPTILSINGLLGQERTVALITVAHLVYKCLVNMASWSWPRIIRDEKNDLAELKEWVSIVSTSNQIL